MDVYLIFVSLFLIQLTNHQFVNSQQTCSNYNDLFDNINKFDPQFDSIAYITPVIRVDSKTRSNLITFSVTDRDLPHESFNDIRFFNVTTNDTNFNIQPDYANNVFILNFGGRLFYNINNAHRYIVELTAYDSGAPQRSGKAIVVVPLLNYNVNPPQFIQPYIISAAVTLLSGSQLGILNAWDIDGDAVSYKLDPSNPQSVLQAIDVQPDGLVRLRTTLTQFEKSFNFTVVVTDDGSSCDISNSTRIVRQSVMTVTLVIIEVNMHSPEFIPNNMGQNFCEQKYQAYENSFFKIAIVARDQDKRGDNGKITILAPEISDRSPQNSFNISTPNPQTQDGLLGEVYNLEKFDYENPKYGSNIMNIMFYAEDNGVPKRRGYCFITVEILDVNDNIPVFAQRTYTIYIHDQYKTRLFNYRFVAIDQDSGLNGQVQYFMANDNPIASNLFNLALDGTLTIRDNAYLDQIQESTQFQIYAQDMSPTRNRSELVTVRVIKTTLKLLPPFFADFPEPAQLIDISEMTTRGTILRNFSIIIQTNPCDQFLRCFLSPKPSPEWFKFEYQNTGQNLTKQEQCYLKIEDPLNYRQASSMVVYMVAEVGNYLMSSTARELKILNIFLKEENISPPKFVTNTIEASVVEGEEDLNKTIAVVKAYDLDKTFPFNKITYEFDQKTNQDGFFFINADTGEIKLVKRIHNKKNIPLEVIAKDGANGYNMNTPNQNNIYVDVKVIDINDNPPKFSDKNRYTYDVFDNQPPGYVIATLEVEDEDAESFFNFSINDSTFGIRPIFDQTKTKSLNYKGSAEIYLNNYLDFFKKNVYNLKVYVSDSQFLTAADLTINILNANDRPPAFNNLPYVVRIDEITIPNGPIITLSASDNDNQPDNFFYEHYSTPYLDKSWFNLDSKTGQLTLLKGLDRDAPNGMPIYYLPVSVTDLSKVNGQKAFTTIRIELNDVNDNAPFLVYSNFKPLIITEEDSNAFVEFYVVDVDTPKYGPPFTLMLDNYTDLFGVQQINCPNCNDRAKYQLYTKKSLLRESQKYFVIPYIVSDNGGLSRTSNFQLIIGDIDNNPQTDGSKSVKIISYNKNILPSQFLGTLYVKDKDDWDLITKKSSNCIQTPANTFDVQSGLRIIGPNKFDNLNVMNLKCSVQDQSSAIASAQVDFFMDNVDYTETVDLAGLRLFGITAEDLMKKINVGDTNILERLIGQLISILGLNPQIDARSDFIKVVTVRNYVAEPPTKLIPNQIPNFDSSTFGSDIYFYARKDRRLLSSRLIYSLINSNLNKFTSSDYSGLQLLFDQCSNKPTEFCPGETRCKQTFSISRNSLTVDANATSFVGMNNKINTDCYCKLEVSQPICYNGGTIVNSAGGSDYYCNCPSGYDGPRCEQLSLTFSFSPSSPSHSYALFKNFELCDPMRIEFEFSTDRSKGLLLFNGPVNRDSIYFIAVEIQNKTLLVHIGYTNISFPNINVSDKQWHKVDILMSLDAVQVILDKCQAQNVRLPNYLQMVDDKQNNDDSKLSLGGIPPSISINHYYYNVLNVFEYEGCIRNLKVNGDYRNLKLSSNPNDFNLAENNQKCDCIYLGVCDSTSSFSIVRTNEFPWWIIIIIIGTLILLAIILGFAVCTIRRKDNQKKMLQMFPDDDIRETIINYADGAGEENTENFNIGVMKKPVGPIIQPTGGTANLISVNNQGGSAEPYSNDQNMIYAYEGEGSEAGSLSSLSENYSGGDQEYDYLKEWGPKFYKLSSIYLSHDETKVTDYQTNLAFDYNNENLRK